MTQTPLMILSDAPSSYSGLGRITRELATRIDQFLPDRFRLATLGSGGVGCRRFPWPQYSMVGNPGERGWFVPELYHAWKDFAGDEPGVLLTIWDASRLRWLVDPRACPNPTMRSWLAAKPFKLWGYWPQDTEGVGGKLPRGFAEVMRQFDRNLPYTGWAQGLIANTLYGHAVPEFGKLCDALPHGIDTSVWYPRDRKQMREEIQKQGLTALTDDTLLVGIVAANQPRKDWALGFEACALVRERNKRDVLVWCHTDTAQSYWDLPGLAEDFGIEKCVIITKPPTLDDDLAKMYSACDVTLGIGLGEGFGYPIFESLACGTPCIHGAYGGAVEYLPASLVVEPVAFRYEGNCNCRRPVFNPADWSARIEQLKQIDAAGKFRPAFPFELDWENLWPRWSRWLCEGIVQRSADIGGGV